MGFEKRYNGYSFLENGYSIFSESKALFLYNFLYDL